MPEDIRWIQRLQNYQKALNSLRNDIELASTRPLTDIERRGLIQAFEYTYELAWNLIKDFYQAAGEVNIQGSRDAFKLAFNRGLVQDDTLLETIKSRQMTSHSYNQITAEEIYQAITNTYFQAFEELANSLEQQQNLREH